jgi:citrate synthase
LIHISSRVTIDDYDDGSGIRVRDERTNMSESSGTGFVAGLEEVVAAETRLSGVDGEAGELTIAGFSIEELAGRASFEETVYLLWRDALPDPEQLADFRAELAGRRELSRSTLDLLRAVAAEKVPVMDALRMASGTVSPGTDDEEALALVACLPTIVAAYSRMLEGEEPVDPDPELGHAANYLYMLTGEAPGAEFERALETYLNTVCDHGMNASTFVARVIVSTRSDFVSAVVGAIGALKGPLHGGAPGPALDVVFEIGDAGRAEAYLREKLGRGERLMGFGHRIYRVRDPRADVLAAAAERLYTTDGDRELYGLALDVEQTALSLLAEHKPGRNLQTNVEFYTALLLHGLGLSTQLFTPTFAVGRVAGWTAHCFEQRALDRLIRPQSLYVGSKDRRWVPLEER